MPILFSVRKSNQPWQTGNKEPADVLTTVRLVSTFTLPFKEQFSKTRKFDVQKRSAIELAPVLPENNFSPS
jgi:hypothetical protein